MLSFRIRGIDHPFDRFPGGGIISNENQETALFREIYEESGIKKNELVYLRKLGTLRYYKPIIHKNVDRHDFVLLHNGTLPYEFDFIVKSDDKDNNLTFHYKWLTLNQLDKIDPELAQFVNSYNFPELFIKAEDWGLEKRTLRFRNHNPEWQRIYEFEEIEIRRRVQGIVNVEHIGSTSVRDLCSKPIIDILIGFLSRHEFEKSIPELERTGYTFHGHNGIKGRMYFTKGSKTITMFHLHCFNIDSAEYKEHLKVRDALRENKTFRDKYIALKKNAEEIKMERTDYQNSKAKLMDDIVTV